MINFPYTFYLLLYIMDKYVFFSLFSYLHSCWTIEISVSPQVCIVDIIIVGILDTLLFNFLVN